MMNDPNALNMLGVAAAAAVIVSTVVVCAREALLGTYSPANTRGLYKSAVVALSGAANLVVFVIQRLRGCETQPWALWFIALAFVIFAPAMLRWLELSWRHHVLACGLFLQLHNVTLYDSGILEGQPIWLLWLVLSVVAGLLLLPKLVPEFNEDRSRSNENPSMMGRGEPPTVSVSSHPEIDEKS